MPRQVKIAPECQRWLKECEFPTDDSRGREVRAMLRVCEAVRSWAQYEPDFEGGIDRNEESLQSNMVQAINALERISAG